MTKIKLTYEFNKNNEQDMWDHNVIVNAPKLLNFYQDVDSWHFNLVNNEEREQIPVSEIIEFLLQITEKHFNGLSSF